MILWGKERTNKRTNERTNERTNTTTKHITTLLLRSRVKGPRFCSSLYILGTWGVVVGFKYEWKVKGECILTHYLKNYFILYQFSVKPGLWHENWHFLENHPHDVVVITPKQPRWVLSIWTQPKNRCHVFIFTILLCYRRKKGNKWESVHLKLLPFLLPLYYHSADFFATYVLLLGSSTSFHCYLACTSTLLCNYYLCKIMVF